MKNNFSLSGLLSVSWNLVKAHPVPVLGFCGLYFCVLIGLAAWQTNGSVGGSILFNLCNIFGQAFFFLFYMGMLLNIADGRRINEFQNGWTKFGRILAISLIQSLGLLVVLSLILIPLFCYVTMMQIPVLKLLSFSIWSVYILGGFILVCYVYLRLCFAVYIVVDQDKDILSSFELSWCITKSKIFRIWLLMLVQTGLIIGGALCLLVGVFVAIPLCAVMTMFFYRGLLKENSDNESLSEDLKSFNS